MKRVVIQAGHIGKAGAGSPGEQEVNKRIADRLSAVLRDRGFEIIQTDYYAYNDTKVTKQDHDLFLALHCDMDYAGDNGSGFADYPEPSTDGATKESQRITKILNESYFPEVKIVYKNRSNANTRYYYMWKYLTLKTPCVLIEMGQTQDPHDRVLLGNTDLIANAIGRAVCKAFNINFDSISNGGGYSDDNKVEIERLKKLLEEQKKSYDTQILEIRSNLADKEKECLRLSDTLLQISRLSTL